MMRHPRSLFMLGTLLGFVFTNSSQGAVIYTQISVRRNPDGTVPIDKTRVGDWMLAATAGAHKSYEFDVDGDGNVDFGLYSTVDGTEEGQSMSGVYASPKLGVEILGFPYPPPYVDPDALPVGMSAGSIIGADSPSLYDPSIGVQWGGPDFRTGKFVMLGAPMNVGQGGIFYVGNEDVTGFLAFRILKEDGWHYGWLEAAGGGMGLTIYGIGWETDPNQALIAGVVPEPSAAVLAGTALRVLMLRRKSVSPKAGFHLGAEDQSGGDCCGKRVSETAVQAATSVAEIQAPENMPHPRPLSGTPMEGKGFHQKRSGLPPSSHYLGSAGLPPRIPSASTAREKRRAGAIGFKHAGRFHPHHGSFARIEGGEIGDPI